MKGFVHTFCLETALDRESFDRLKKTYKDFFYNHEKETHVLDAYSQRGLRIEIKNRNRESEIKYDKKHRLKKATMIFTTYKLLHPGEKLGAVRSDEDIIETVRCVVALLKEIYDKTGVDLFCDAKMKRVDVTGDVITPSEQYSKEIIRIAKLVLLPYGYKFWQPDKNENYNTEWSDDNAVFFYNHSQELAAKIYNKKADLEVSREMQDIVGDKGVVRFEVTLKRRFLIQRDYMPKDGMNPRALAGMLRNLTRDSDQLLAEYVGNIVTTGEMLSKKVLFKYIECQCGNKVKRCEKMKRYAEIFNQRGCKRIEEYGKTNEIKTVEKYYAEMKVSPIYTKKECPYIPSFERLFKGECDRFFLNLAERYNVKRKHVCLYWDAEMNDFIDFAKYGCNS